MTDSKNTPELRFPGFTEPWEEKKLGEVFEFIKNYSYSRNDEGDGEYFHIHYGDIHSKYSSFIEGSTEIPSIKNLGKHIRLETSDIILADASEDYSDLGKAILLKSKNNRKIIAGLHTFALRPKNNKYINPEYFLYYTKTDMYKKYMAKVGTGTSVFGINKKNLELLLIPLSNISEQEKIGFFFSSLDKKLDLQKDRLEELKSYKKGMMQRIFDQEIRFKDENGRNYPDWQEKKLGEIGEFLTSSVNKKIEANEEIVRLYNYMDVYNKISIDNKKIDNLSITSATKTQIENNNLLKGDILITPSSETPEDIGHSVVIREDLQNTLYSYHLIRFRPNITMDILFSNYWFNNEKVRKEFIIKSQGATRFTLSINNIKEVKVKYPCSSEQEKIGLFLSNLDRKIELEEEKLRSYEEFKKGLMQRMFV